jgi:hypothetical protein
VAQKVLLHFPCFSQNQQEVFLIFLWLSLNVLFATAVLWNSTFSGTRAGVMEMSWYGDVRFKRVFFF